MDQEKPETQETPRSPDEIEFDEDVQIENLLPNINIHVKPDEDNALIGDAELVELYKEILQQSRADRKDTDEVLTEFREMVMNQGESSSAAKEAIVNLMKIKTDIADKMTKVADLMTRIKLKERDTFPRYLAVQQNNKIADRRDLIKKLDQKQKRKK